MGWIPGLGRSLRGESGNPLQYSSLVNPMDRGAWWANAHGVTKSQTRLSTCTCGHTHTHAHMHAHTCTHMCAHIHAHTYIRAHTDIRAHMHSHIHTRTCTHTRIHTHTVYQVCKYLIQISLPPKDLRTLLPFSR